MDFKELGSNLGLEEEEFVERVEIFISSAAADIDALKTSCENQDPNQAAEAAHSLKGSAGNLGFSELSEGAKKAEESGKNENFEEINALLPELEVQLKKINTVLTSYQNK